MPQVPPNPGIMQKKLQKGGFLKKDSRKLKKKKIVLGSYVSLKGPDR